ncbi:MAG: radical SAM protein [Candidatus Jettenia sp.]|uniref:Iron-sulfur cluster-binding oxidoreductase n=1 Tax=Candidatus Jettenia caeni TaxID=247490 RepID=I3INB3_9BACT|nr:radical SAM protein [Candidatus Jettenia sp. AMX1]MBC6928089.1 radical SAM protein [Candidatus Jettenia sp.]NUN23373.1 radical SAM protein [Candidatus Jettenia caeni]KAA0251190.1 MAG: radical SAM protein [Candidatus Jettenia sp. AMX1]MCE7879270.1 radical SAM protein [Candidatus Jettenia sp. AMX1]MCQ3927504.1 radical SAM protein [Candidatus Jettenia sp.]
MEAAIITTYRCPNKCYMCNVWKHPTKREEEFKPSLLEKLPSLEFANVTGGEPFLRDDIEEIISVLRKKAKRIVMSTNGYFTQKILAIAQKNKNIGIRISIEGLPAANDELRGVKDGFDHGLRTLLELQRLGFKDIGFGITVSDRNAKDMIELYQLAKTMNVEFATAAVHNSYYFHKYDNEIQKKEEVITCFEEIVRDLLKSKKIKNLYRAYFNYGLINYIRGNKRLLPCEAGTENFFLDPWGDIRPCNGMEENIWFESMGNLKEKSFEEIWRGEKAKQIREKVKTCPKNCWMIGTAAPVMKKYFIKPTAWIIKNKMKTDRGKGRGFGSLALGKNNKVQSCIN